MVCEYKIWNLSILFNDDLKYKENLENWNLKYSIGISFENRFLF